MTDRPAFSKPHLPALTQQQELADWLIAVGLLLLVWVQVTLPLALLLIGLHVPRVPAFPEGGRILLFGPGIPSPFEYVLLAACFLPLGLRRRYPLAVLGVVTVAAGLYEAMTRPPAMSIIAVLVAVYTVGTLYDRASLAVASLVSAFALFAVNLGPTEPQLWIAQFLRTASLIAMAAAVGDAMRNQRAYIAEVEQRALEAERTREEEARRRVDEERLRIARELHDVTAHSLSVIAVQSGAAAHVLDTKPQEARRALEAIRTTSRDALTELRRMVGVLRGEEPGEAPHEPVATIAQLPVLAEQFRHAGLTVGLEVPEDLSAVPAVVDSSAYRVAQESLTNALRHAGAGTKASVRIALDAAGLTVEVADTGAGPPSDWTEGHGIAGMRERAVALGGTFEAAPGPDGGFVVTATYPLPAMEVQA